MRLLVVLLASALLLPAGPYDNYIAAMEKNLTGNILRFWHPRAVDREHGGYHLAYDAQGKPRPGGSKMIVTQARMLWFFSKMAREGYGNRAEMLEAADAGFRFLRDRMWDQQHGGFYWEVDTAGTHVRLPGKHLYGQAFALYGLSEFAMASGRSDALDLARRQFEVMEQRAHDREYGGYIEFFGPDWKEMPAGAQSYMGGGTAGLKLMNTHLHLMEALTAYYEATRSPIARERLLELIAIEAVTVVRQGANGCTDKFERDWTRRLDNGWDRVSYGHDIENVWLLADALHTAGKPSAPYQELFEKLYANSRQYGYDEQHGGFFDSGPFGQPADRKAKVWWVQAEALVSSLKLFALTGRQSYFDTFAQTWEFVNTKQADWEHGEWHSTVREDGVGTGDKGQNWKSAYHNGRAMMECIKILKALSHDAKPSVQ